MNTTTHATIAYQVSLEVTDPDAFLTWAAAAADAATEGRPAVWRDATRALVANIPSALRWAYKHDPDTNPPGVTVTSRALDVQTEGALAR